MPQSFVNKNSKTGKFECTIPIKGDSAMKFADARIISPSAAIPFNIWFAEDTETHKVVITNKKPESGPIENPSQWLFEGYFLENGQKFKGYYNTRTRSGHITFIN
jgi:hypothetical protein